MGVTYMLQFCSPCEIGLYQHILPPCVKLAFHRAIAFIGGYSHICFIRSRCRSKLQRALFSVLWLEKSIKIYAKCLK
ncbi:hypothetical protein GDO78_011096 [Eleutherodactylus coqui]|uniref:Uncharacterized protein n=1 Tax=Eleutherodactylus coqui TaxID=57060 RepID=A0A8J6K717_ELECQ|nr:hypothetical protein GDO78_011096 [Eleutherodactylus coqui]